MPPPHPDAVADCVLSAFHALPAKCKPRKLADGRKEWVPLAGIVLSRGMKCLPQAKLSAAKGNVLHDWHAEVLAIRAFNRWLVDECAELARRGMPGTHGEGGSEGAWVRWRRRGEVGREVNGHGGERASTVHEREPEAPGRGPGGADGPRYHDREQEHAHDQLFAIQDNVRIHMYCSEAPCGDASMELTMAAQADATPWTSPPPTEDSGMLLGRGNFDHLGVVRRKPARPDAPLTLSKSCSDKLALKQCTSLLSGVTSLLVHPGEAYLGMLVLPERRCVREAVRRAFGREGRMSGVAAEGVQKRWRDEAYIFKPFEVVTTEKEFEYSKEHASCGEETEAATLVPSNLGALYTPRRQEVLINGMLQGRRQDDPRGASCASRRRTWEAVRDVAESAGLPLFQDLTACEGYAGLKGSGRLKGRERVKEDVRERALKGWKRNVGDEEWGLV
ncbi:hypothetical protein LTR36_009556 [Oleoguttula mirabilis]|uniref:A to I editase domain-containing protein n=1 Tax=Oleoguttula mirabilis TaxID=1507867 RepID=A0AAV9JTA3_9PEZI|nr:hypothetical protein LTR36_009556 [Oleoguttula mirabilis]